MNIFVTASNALSKIDKYLSVKFAFKYVKFDQAISDDCDLIAVSEMLYSPSVFVSLIKNAKCVVTSPFYATVSSIIFRKQFYTISLHDGQYSRYVDFLHPIEADTQLIELDFITSKFDLDYEKVQKNLSTSRKSSI